MNTPKGKMMSIRACIARDIPSICGIYNHYIANTVITFEETPVSVADMQQRIDTNTRIIVAREWGARYIKPCLNNWRQKASMYC